MYAKQLQSIESVVKIGPGCSSCSRLLAGQDKMKHMPALLRDLGRRGALRKPGAKVSPNYNGM